MRKHQSSSQQNNDDGTSDGNHEKAVERWYCANIYYNSSFAVPPPLQKKLRRNLKYTPRLRIISFVRHPHDFKWRHSLLMSSCMSVIAIQYFLGDDVMKNQTIHLKTRGQNKFSWENSVAITFGKEEKCKKCK